MEWNAHTLVLHDDNHLTGGLSVWLVAAFLMAVVVVVANKRMEVFAALRFDCCGCLLLRHCHADTHKSLHDV